MRIDRRFWWLAAMLLLLICGGLIFATYWFGWSKTGFLNKSLWDWLQLLIIPAVLALGGYLFTFTTSRNEQKLSERYNQTEREIAQDNQHEAILQEYVDKMSELLLHEKLRKSEPEDEVRKIARVRTLTVLPRLDGKRKRSVLQFLHESNLIDKNNPIIDVSGADFSGANLYGVGLSGVNLFGANLSGADLTVANLENANLSGAKLCHADLSSANLNKVNLENADLSEVKLHGTNLKEANLSGAELVDADLSGMHLMETTKLDGTDQIRGAVYRVLSGANLYKANLSGADFSGANLSNVTLDGAKGTTTEQLQQSLSLKGAIMPDGSIQP